jgi:CHASE2 domain-containing sensor protein
MIEVILTVAAVVAGGGLYMWRPEGHREWGIVLSAIGGLLFLYAGLLSIGWWEPPIET